MENEKSNKNKYLRPFGPSGGLSTEEQRRMQRNGGIASGKARRDKKRLKDCLALLLEMKHTDSMGEKKTGAEMMAITAFDAAVQRDWEAWRLVRDTSGQKPSDKLVVSEIDPDLVAEIEREVCGMEMEHDKF